LPCLNNTSNGRTGRKAARRYILSLKQEGLRRRHAKPFVRAARAVLRAIQPMG
jgi:hypothetical protein